MYRPSSLKTKIFLDSGDPEDTKAVLDILGFLDGQTTNPSLVARKLKDQPTSLPREAGRHGSSKFSQEELLQEYKIIVTEISRLIPHGSVSIEVYADAQTSADTMFRQGVEMFSWIPNAHIKFPTTRAGLEAASRAVKYGMRVNMTLVFTQSQAAAVYAATLREHIQSESSDQARSEQSLSEIKDVFVSPFIGRLDDRHKNGIDLVANITKMYEKSDHHVANLAASIRHLDHFKACIKVGADIITAPFAVLREWADEGMLQKIDYRPCDGQERIAYQELDLHAPWTTFDITHDLTDKGLKKFADDWNSLIERTTENIKQ